MASQTEQLHFLLVPLMSQSRLIPFTDLAKLLADNDQHVSIVMTPLNAKRYRKTIESDQNSGHRIQLVTLNFPCKEAGLPEGCENVDLLPEPGLFVGFFRASNMVQDQLEDWLEGLEARPNCLISDFGLPYTSEVALRFSIPRVVFHGISCFTLFCSSVLKRYEVPDSVASDWDPFLVPGIPDKIEFTLSQLPEFDRKGTQRTEFREWLDRFQEAEASSQGVVVNSFEELEPNYVEGYRQQVSNVWCVGPVSLPRSKPELIDQGLVGNDKEEGDPIMEWLGSKKTSSVLYVCFGSLCHVPFEQLIELGLGLEASGHPFIWAIREGDYTSKLEDWIKEETFNDRVKERGLVIRGWAPQVLILSHPSVGGFLTHCGWNSTLEAVCAGLPMVTWPMSAEQFYNEKLVVHVLKIGVRVGANTFGVLVKREEVKVAVEELMDGDENEERRGRAKELGEMARRAVGPSGSSHSNITALIHHVMKQVEPPS